MMPPPALGAVAAGAPGAAVVDEAVPVGTPVVVGALVEVALVAAVRPLIFS